MMHSSKLVNGKRVSVVVGLVVSCLVLPLHARSDEFSADNINAVFCTARMLLKEGNTKQASELLVKVVNSQPAAPVDRHVLLDLKAQAANYLGNISSDRHDFKSAVRYYQLAARLYEELHGKDNCYLVSTLQKLRRAMRENGDNFNDLPVSARLIELRSKAMSPQAVDLNFMKMRLEMLSKKKGDSQEFAQVAEALRSNARFLGDGEVF